MKTFIVKDNIHNIYMLYRGTITGHREFLKCNCSLIELKKVQTYIEENGVETLINEEDE